MLGGLGLAVLGPYIIPKDQFMAFMNYDKDEPKLTSLRSEQNNISLMASNQFDEIRPVDSMRLTTN